MDENEEQERQAEEERRRQEEDRIREQEEETRRREAEERQREEQRNQEEREEKEKAEEDKKYEDSKEGTLEQMNENNGNNFNSQHAVERYKTVKGLYEEIPITQRLFSRLLPNRWTHAGRMRDATNIAERMMEREVNGNDLGNSKDPEFKGMTQKQKLLAEYKQNYSNIRKEYNKLSGWQKFIGAVLPANWTKAGKLNTDVKMNDMFFRQKQQDYSRLQMNFIKKMEADKLDHPETANKPTEAERKVENQKINNLVEAKNLNDLNVKEQSLEEFMKDIDQYTDDKEILPKDQTKEVPQQEAEIEAEMQGKNGGEPEQEMEKNGKNVEKTDEKDVTQASEDLGENEVDFNPEEAESSDDFNKENSKETLDLQARLNEDTLQINSSTDFIENDDLEMVNAMQNENERENNR